MERVIKAVENSNMNEILETTDNTLFLKLIFENVNSDLLLKTILNNIDHAIILESIINGLKLTEIRSVEIDEIDETNKKDKMGEESIENKKDEKNIVINFSDEQKLFLQLALDGANIFLTGPPGTGKSFVLQHTIKELQKKYDLTKVGVTATTGKAAILIGGTTIHSFLGIGIAEKSSKELFKIIHNSKKNKEKYLLLKNLRVLIIDEISMMSSELFIKISNYLKLVKNNELPFGGLQVIVTGDFCQLPPVKGEYAFKCNMWKNLKLRVVQLKSSFRQKDDLEFQDILNNIRFGNIDDMTYNKLRNKTHSKMSDSNVPPTKLFSLNKQVDNYNSDQLIQLCKKTDQKPKIFNIHYPDSLSYNQREYAESHRRSYQIPEIVELAVGATVMITFNINIAANLVNGTVGIIEGFEEEVYDKFKLRIINGSPVRVDNINIVKLKTTYGTYNITYISCHDPNSIDPENPTSLFCYMPLKLAYATSIHKAQGSTIDFAEINLMNSFGDGMGYTAISRCRTFESMIITGIAKTAFRCNPDVKKYYESLVNTDD